MKLKKIASLMLAGIMAVSMLAGCNNVSNNNGNNGEGEGEGATASGYSAKLGEKLAKTLKEEGLDKIVTFADSSKDQAALEDAVTGYGALNLIVGSATTDLTPIINEDVEEDFKDAAETEDRELTPTEGDFYDVTTKVGNTRKIGGVFYIDGTVSEDKAIDKLVAMYETAFKTLEKDVTVKDQDGKTTKYDFAYSVSVSVVNVPATSVTIYNNSVNFIALTITRTASVK